MKKILTVFSALTLTGTLFAGGLVTNSNQSALYTRLQNRNASTDIDAVYYNPAGLTKLNDGYHFSINNQTIGQTKTVETMYTHLTGGTIAYEGKVSAPVYPGIYAVYKTGKMAFSFGFNPVGGGGGAKYDKGLPSFEMPIADLKPTLTNGFGVTTTNYSADIFFEGTSIYFGFQLNASYEINDLLSVAVGGRLVTAKNTYSGSIENIMINPLYPGNPTAAMMPAPTFFTSVGQPGYAAMTSNTYADAEMTGKGFTPIVSVNITPFEKLNVSLKYEFKTALELKTKVNDNKTAGLFIQDSTAIADIPAIFSAGINYRPISKLLVSGSFNYYFDKDVDYDGQADVEEVRIDKNFIEGGLGVEYSITEKLRASAGWVTTKTGANDKYNSDMTYSTNTNSYGAGFGYRVNEMIDVNLGASKTFYEDGMERYNHRIAALGYDVPAKNTYKKSTWIVGIGVDLHF